jgi:putative transposase
MSRKVKFSNNWKKAKRKVQNLHSRIGNIRRDYLHKVSTTISKNHAMMESMKNRGAVTEWIACWG